MALKVDLSKFENWLSPRNKVGRALWVVVSGLFFRTAALPSLWPWRRTLLRLFGAKVDRRSYVHWTADIWAPWNLEMGEYSCLATGVIMYNTGRVVIGAHSTVSQRAYLCTSSHDISDPKFRMVCSDMRIGDQVWIASEAFVGGAGVSLGEGVVVGARAVVTKSVEPWTVVAGNPAREIKKRVIRES